MRIALIAASAALLSLTATAQAVEVTQTVEIAAPAARVWETSSADFCGIGTFHPAIEKCELADKGKKRTLTLKGGGTIVEKRLSWDAAKHSYSYAIVESPLPVANYKSTFTVKANGEKSSIVTWTGTFDAKGASEAEAKKAIDGIYSSGLATLKQKY